MKYIVEIPWAGVKKGQLVEFEKLHPSLKANVKPFIEVEGDDVDKAKSEAVLIIEQANGKAELIISNAETEASKILAAAKAKVSAADVGTSTLTPATPEATSEKSAIDLSDKDQVKAKLKELNIEFDGRSSLEDLVALLPA
ncbi:hypothetical protein [Vibrio fluvialis]|uniref:hypothetical protein n=1 Tax=Vibrio fluvialis TaxID=676 RepID=UPI003D7C97B8